MIHRIECGKEVFLVNDKMLALIKEKITEMLKEESKTADLTERDLDSPKYTYNNLHAFDNWGLTQQQIESHRPVYGDI